MIRAACVVELSVQDYFFTTSSPSPIALPVWQQWFQIWLATLSPEIPQAELYELTLRLSDDEAIQDLNYQYRGKASPTDVLAFAALEVDVPMLPSSLETLYLGDLVISVPTASRQAQEREHSLTFELAWLATHGLLHLLGWDHPDEESLRKMLSQQQKLLNLTNLGS